MPRYKSMWQLFHDMALFRPSLLAAEEGRTLSGGFASTSSAKAYPPPDSPRTRQGSGGGGLSRFWGGASAVGGPSGFLESLASESTGVLLHSGFGGQLLSVQLGKGGLGLSQGTSHAMLLATVVDRACQNARFQPQHISLRLPV